MGNNMTPNIPSMGYPNVDNVNTWLTQTQFNYSLWAANSLIRLFNVPWRSDYKDVVKFEDDAARDAWFSANTNAKVRIDKAVRVPREDMISLPFNYDEAINYNYLVAEYELPNGYTAKGNKVKTKYFYFIDEMRYKNANVVEMRLTLDVWTTFINDITIGMMDLHRGHAPMTLTSVSEYLADPVNNLDGLLTPDINFGEATQVKNEDFIPFHSGDQYIVFATSAYMTDTWADNVPCCNAAWTDGVPNNLMLFAIPASDYGNFCNAFEANAPQFAQTIEGIFICDANFITIGTSFTFCGITCYNVSSKNTTLKNIQLDSSMFDYDSDYDWITKLYTFPYAQLQVTDNNGQTVNIKIEDTSSSLGVKSMSSIVFPFLNIDAFLSGVNGSGSNSYTIKRMSTSDTIDMGIDGWQNYKWSVDIPVYTIYQKNSIAYNYGTKFDRIQKQNDINTSFNNTAASAQTSFDNTAASAQTSYDNTAASAQTAYDNSDRSIDLTYDIVENNATLASDLMVAANNASADIVNYDQHLICANHTRAKAYSALSIAHSYSTLGASMAASAVSMGVSAITGNASGVAAQGANVLSSGFNAAINVGLDEDVAAYMYGPLQGTERMDVTLQPSDLIGPSSPSDANAHGGMEGILAWYTLKNAQEKQRLTALLNRDSTNMSNVTTRTNRDLSRTTGRANNTASKTTADGNNTRSKNTADGNNTRSKTTTDANNARTKTNGEAAITNAINQAALRPNNPHGSYGGNAQLEVYGTRGLDIKVLTQNKYAIENAAMTFLRYGYMYDSFVQTTDLNLMTRFTYWECNDVYLKSDNAYEGALREIKDIFHNGVTVWVDPDDIGIIQITENIPIEYNHT